MSEQAKITLARQVGVRELVALSEIRGVRLARDQADELQEVWMAAPGALYLDANTLQNVATLIAGPGTIDGRAAGLIMYITYQDGSTLLLADRPVIEGFVSARS